MVPHHKAQQDHCRYGDGRLQQQRIQSVLVEISFNFGDAYLRHNDHKHDSQQSKSQGKITDNFPSLKEALALGQTVSHIVILPRLLAERAHVGLGGLHLSRICAHIVLAVHLKAPVASNKRYARVFNHCIPAHADKLGTVLSLDHFELTPSVLETTAKAASSPFVCGAFRYGESQLLCLRVWCYPP